MSVRRIVAVVVLLVLAVLVAPAAMTPGLNMADVIVILAPILLVAIVARPSRTPAGSGSSPDVQAPSPDA